MGGWSKARRYRLQVAVGKQIEALFECCVLWRLCPGHFLCHKLILVDSPQDLDSTVTKWRWRLWRVAAEAAVAGHFVQSKGLALGEFN